jgi:hypothetical protein
VLQRSNQEKGDMGNQSWFSWKDVKTNFEIII